MRGQDHGDAGRNNERNFFPPHLRQGSALQRIIVEQEKNHGQRHRAGFRQQGEDVQQDRQDIPPRSLWRRVRRIAKVGEQRQQIEKPGENVFSLGGPGHRLHPQRMKSEQERRQRGRFLKRMPIFRPSFRMANHRRRSANK